MNISKILEFIKCPYCINENLTLQDEKLICDSCQTIFQIIDGVPVLMKTENLCKHEKKQAEWFNRHYSRFSKNEYRLENWRLSMLNRIFDVSFKSRVKTYLDIGCGATGYTIIEAAKRNNWLSFGIDISLEAMLKARNLAKNQGVGDITAFLVCSAENLPFRPGTLDYISSISSLEHLENDEKAIMSFHAILKDKGYIYICVPNAYKRMRLFLRPIYMYIDYRVGHKRHYAIETLNSKMEKDNAFELERIFYNGHLIKLCQLIFDKLHLIDNAKWWLMEKDDINKNYTGIQLNVIYRKK